MVKCARLVTFNRIPSFDKHIGANKYLHLLRAAVFILNIYIREMRFTVLLCTEKYIREMHYNSCRT